MALAVSREEKENEGQPEPDRDLDDVAFLRRDGVVFMKAHRYAASLQWRARGYLACHGKQISLPAFGLEQVCRTPIQRIKALAAGDQFFKDTSKIGVWGMHMVRYVSRKGSLTGSLLEDSRVLPINRFQDLVNQRRKVVERDPLLGPQRLDYSS